MKTLWRISTTSTLVAFVLGIVFLARQLTFSATPVSFGIPEFHWVIINGGDIHPTTPSVERTFDEAKDWGKDGVLPYMTLRAGSTGQILVNVWRQSEVPGVFEHAQHLFDARWPLIYTAEKAEIKDGLLQVTPKKSGGKIFLIGLFAIVAPGVLNIISAKKVGCW